VRNNVPGGENVGEFLPSGVDRAGEARVEGLIEHLRERIHVLEQVPVSLAFPPAPDAGLPRLACSLLSPAPSVPSPLLGMPANANPSLSKGEGSAPATPAALGGGPFVIAGLGPPPRPPPFQGEGNPVEQAHSHRAA
jgi:hypothetical protein